MLFLPQYKHSHTRLVFFLHHHLSLLLIAQHGQRRGQAAETEPGIVQVVEQRVFGKLWRYGVYLLGLIAPFGLWTKVISDFEEEQTVRVFFWRGPFSTMRLGAMPSYAAVYSTHHMKKLIPRRMRTTKTRGRDQTSEMEDQRQKNPPIPVSLGT